MRSLLFAIMLSVTSTFSHAIHMADSVDKNQWTFTRGALESGPRGGTSSGVSVHISKKTTPSWKAVREENISSFERDRRAIKALAGEFKANFEFMETILLDTNKDFDIPYASWGTEFVKVVEERDDFIALQHILVMFFKDSSSGQTVGPVVVKHWRQDWTWEPVDQLVFQGDNHWKMKKLNVSESQGKWKWTVYQVDDTPRYSMLGTWTHMQSASMFNSSLFTRPLPRREFSVRDDYKILLGNDSIILTPNSWYHEQKNFKHVGKLGFDHAIDESPLRSREIGHNSYLRLEGFDFSAGYDYWQQTEPYWSDVVQVWREILDSHSEFELKKSVNGKKLFEVHFKNAQDSNILAMSSAKRQQLIRTLIQKYLK